MPSGSTVGSGMGNTAHVYFCIRSSAVRRERLDHKGSSFMLSAVADLLLPYRQHRDSKAGGLADRQQKTETRPYAKLPSDSLSLHERDDSVVKSASCCSSKGPEFSFYHPHQVAHRCPSFHLHEIQCPQLAYRQRGTPLPFHIWIHSLTQKYTHTHYSGLSG